MRNRRGCGIIGCFGFVAFVACAFIVAGGIFYFLRSSDVYQMALAEAQDHPAVIARLGEPINDGWLMSGSIETNDDEGTANFSIPLSGPNGSGSLEVRAIRTEGMWEFIRLDLVTDTERVSLLGTGR